MEEKTKKKIKKLTTRDSTQHPIPWSPERTHYTDLPHNHLLDETRNLTGNTPSTQPNPPTGPTSKPSEIYHTHPDPNLKPTINPTHPNPTLITDKQDNKDNKDYYQPHTSPCKPPHSLPHKTHNLTHTLKPNKI